LPGHKLTYVIDKQLQAKFEKIKKWFVIPCFCYKDNCYIRKETKERRRRGFDLEDS